MQQLDSRKEAKTLLLKREIPFCGFHVFLQYVDSNGVVVPMCDPGHETCTIFVPRGLVRVQQVFLLDEALAHIENYIKCVLWRDKGDCEEGGEEEGGDGTDCD